MKALRTKSVSLLLVLSLVVMMALPAGVAAQPTVNLGSTSTFAVLAGTTITNTGPTTIIGDVGLHPGTSFTGQTSVTIDGEVHLTDAVAEQAKVDLIVAYDDAAGRTPVTRIASELGGAVLTPGTYDSADGTFELTGTLTLDALGDPNAVFVFKAASTLTTAVSSRVELLNGAWFCRIFWQVGSSATLGADSIFVGHILAMESITANTRATVAGQLLARNGAVTLDTNTITNEICFSITVDKVDDSSPPIGLSGAVFALYAGTDTEATPLQTVTMADSSHTWTGLAAGTYTVKEVTPPAGYDKPSIGYQTVTLTTTDSIVVDATLTFVNTPTPPPPPPPPPVTPGAIRVDKVDDGTPFVGLPGAVFALFAGTDTGATPLQTVTLTGSSHTWTGLAAGTYTVKEVTPPAGYSKPSIDYQTVTLTTTNNIVLSATLTFVNTLTPLPVTPGTIRVDKTDDGTPFVGLPGAVFALYAGTDTGATPLQTVTMIGSSHTWTGLAAGIYTVKEVTPPAGYSKPSIDYQTVTLTTTGNVVLSATLTFVNTLTPLPVTPGTIRVDKVDDGTPSVGLPGAVFALYAGTDTGATPLQTVTMIGSSHTWTGLAAGTYTVKEVTPPAGYSKPSIDYQTVTLTTTDNVVLSTTLTFVNASTTNIPAELPETGAYLPTTGFGLALVAAGAVLRRRRRGYR